MSYKWTIANFSIVLNNLLSFQIYILIYHNLLYCNNFLINLNNISTNIQINEMKNRYKMDS